jgi:hypothetical protein
MAYMIVILKSYNILGGARNICPVNLNSSILIYLSRPLLTIGRYMCMLTLRNFKAISPSIILATYLESMTLGTLSAIAGI